MRATDEERRFLPAADAAALVLFVLIGTASHDDPFDVGHLAATLIPLLASWFGAASAFGAYRGRGVPALLGTWVVAVPLAALARSLLLGGPWDERLLIFAGVALAFTGLFVLAGRVVVMALGRTGARGSGQLPSPSPRVSSPDDRTS